MSIYDFMTLPSWSDDKIAKKIPSSIFAAVRACSVAYYCAGNGSALELDQAKGTDEADLADLCTEIEDSLERDESVSMRVVSAPTSRLGKRLGAPHSIVVVSASEPSHVRTSAHAFTSSHILSLRGVVASGCVGKSSDEVMRRQIDLLDCLARSALACDAEYDQILDDDFGIATRGEEIDLTLFPFAPAAYHMPYTYKGVSSPLYSKEEWNEPHASESSLLCKDIFKDPNVCRKALDETITPAKLRMTESLLPLELSNREKFDQKKGVVRLLRSERYVASEEVKRSQSQLTNAKAASACLTEELTRTDAKLSEQALTLLSSDKFHASLARVASLGINYNVERGLRIGRTNAEFEAAVQQVSNFHVGAKANFDKALVDFLGTPFPFLSKIVVASEGTLSNVVQILPDKIAHSATSISVVPSNVNKDPKRVPL
uniref:Uncharacterized protein n=1 Tax=Tanacetum cinerariifolium TaxID=118510 RepID=A0A6L2KDU3_TANCI|nr:hypothetical protein [Tanacetum cinerariifolium]